MNWSPCGFSTPRKLGVFFLFPLKKKALRSPNPINKCVASQGVIRELPSDSACWVACGLGNKKIKAAVVLKFWLLARKH